MRLLRFERKIVGAILAVALVPLVASLVLGRSALQDTYAVGVNPRVQEQLDARLEASRDHFRALREQADRTGDAIALDYRVREALGAAAGEPSALDRARRGATEAALRTLLESYDNVSKVTLFAPGVEITTESRARSTNGELRRLELERDMYGPWRVVVVVTTPRAPFEEYERDGEIVEIYKHLEESGDALSATYWAVYIGFLAMVIGAALTLGLVLSRRVTSRVADLVEATERVGAGDLSVEVPGRSDDEVGELTRAFNTMVQDLRESRARITYLQRIGAWQEFARRLAHEIKNPLTPIQLAAQEMERSYSGDDPRHGQSLREARSIIEEEVATLRRLVGEFSSFAKLPQAELSRADLNEFVEDAGAMVEGISEDVKVALDLDVQVAPRPLQVDIDAMMLKRCLDNLLRNAAQAIRGAARSEGRVWVRCAEGPEGRAILEVEDDGPGIPKEMHEHVFDPYLTTKREGTGLGLAIVKKVVLEHNAEVACDAGAAGGARFRITFPKVS